LTIFATALRAKKSRIHYRCSCFLGYCPTSDEIENSKVKSLAWRLRAGSDKETLTNILEWQDRNIKFWTERHPMPTLLSYICLIFVAALVFFWLGFVVSILLLIVLNSQIAVLVWFIQTAEWFFQNALWFVAIFVGSTATALAAIISIIFSNRKFPWKEIPRGLKNTFAPSISMNFLLENKLGVCRDYTKLTSCLLLNIYPNAELYFASAPDHVATGIKIENRLYMLDQRLPILTMDRWVDYRKHRESDTIRKLDPIKKTLQHADKRALLQTEDRPELNAEKLAKRMTELLNVKEQLDDKIVSLQKPISVLWKSGAILYEEDEMVDYSLARYLKARISDELIRTTQITKIEINREKDDLTFSIRFSQTE